MASVADWLMASDEPWTRYRTLTDIRGVSDSGPEALTARREMLDHAMVQGLVSRAADWPGGVLKRHSDAKHAIYAIGTLADFGLRAGDPGMDEVIEAVLSHQAPEGHFQTLLNVPKAFGGTGQDTWTWMACDAPTLLAALCRFGLQDDPQVHRATEHLVATVQGNGWRCLAAPELGSFKGPGKRGDPCPVVNVYALRALAAAGLGQIAAVNAGLEMLLSHWERRAEVKYFLFGIGSDFRKLKYPFVWYNLLHVLDTLSRFPQVKRDPRFQEMVGELVVQADENGRFTATSMYRAWQGWSFADKKQPSPWLTLLALRAIQFAA